MKELFEALKLRILYMFETPINDIGEISYLRNELTIARDEISRLTNLIYNSASTRVEFTETKEDEEPEPIRSTYIPWHLQRAKLEREDRIRGAQLKKEAEANKVSVNVIKPSPVQTTEELENELEVKTDDAISRG